MKSISLACLLSLVLFQAHAQFSVSSNHRFLLKNNKPFFYLGDTGWNLFLRLDSNDVKQYFETRSRQGFTVIQAVVLAEFDGLHAPNRNGDVSLVNDDPEKPNEKYFKYADWVIDEADKYNLNIGLLPTWGDKVFKDTWGAGPEIFNKENAAVYGSWIANRYKNKTNIIWILGGDRTPRNDSDVAIWNAMGNAIKQTIPSAVISFHPQPYKLGSATFFHNEDWLSFNMFQTGHCANEPIYEKMNAVYNMHPVKPVMDAEPIYEDHPRCFDSAKYGTSSAYDVRRSAYLDLFSGAFGHTYGCHDVWQFYAKGKEPINHAHVYWQQAMLLPAAAQMQYVRKLMEHYDMMSRVPDQLILLDTNTIAAERVQATHGDGYALVYSCAGKPFTVKLELLKIDNAIAYWYNPRNGTTTGTKTNGSMQQKFEPPVTNDEKDWVLVIHDSKKYKKL